MRLNIPLIVENIPVKQIEKPIKINIKIRDINELVFGEINTKSFYLSDMFVKYDVTYDKNLPITKMNHQRQYYQEYPANKEKFIPLLLDGKVSYLILLLRDVNHDKSVEAIENILIKLDGKVVLQQDGEMLRYNNWSELGVNSPEESYYLIPFKYPVDFSNIKRAELKIKYYNFIDLKDKSLHIMAQVIY